MVTIQISEETAQRLNEMAAEQNRPVAKIIEAFINEKDSTESKKLNPLLMIAQAAEDAGLRSGQNDIAERSRKILNTDVPDYLKKQLSEQDND